ncbi:MAG: PIG-L family deacetylase [Candidatus Hydrogenedentota bacterium]
MVKRFIILSVVASVAMSAGASERIGLVKPVEPSLGSVALHQALLDVGTDLSLMCVATHPDDEDGATLTYYRKKFGYKTYALIATRGEGGQNEIGSELYEELGVLRTDEMGRASAHTGANLHFLDYPEFGFSKSAEEAFEVWGKEETLRRMVRKIRELRPDVIITHHGENGGHGHHQAVGRALMSSFDMAADPEAFPEQLDEGLEPWQAARLYHRSFGGAGASNSVLVPFAELDPARGISYARIAANALGEHATQGMGFFIDRFLTSRSSATYKLMKGAPGGTQGGGSVDAPSGGLFEGLQDRVSADARALSTETAGGATKKMYAVLASSNDDRSRSRANRLLTTAEELSLTAKVSDAHVTPGQTFTIEVEAIDFGDKVATELEFLVVSQDWFPIAKVETVSKSLDSKGFAKASFLVTVPDYQEPTVPQEEYLFKPNFLAPQLTVVATVKTADGEVMLTSDVLVDVAPAVTVDYLNAPYLVKQGDRESTFSLLVTNNGPKGCEITLNLAASKGVTLEKNSVNLSFANEDEQKLVTVGADIAKGLVAGDYTITASIGGSDYSSVGTARVVDLLIPKNKKVGVIYSYDDTFMDTLERMGVAHESLEEDDFNAEKLDEFTSIIVDIRAYLVRPDLVANNQAMLDYVKRGGTMLVMYQKTFEWNKNYAPYSLALGRNRVTVEEAPITLLQPKHSLFTTPNAMGASDWDGWRQERGLYFPSKWADEYTPLIDVKDPGENPPPGSLLVANYGDGTYLYTALGWYRQLRELHPGTLRIFANMLAL